MSKQNFFTALIQSVQDKWSRKPKYLIVKLSFYELMTTDPPGFSLNGWDETGIKAWLKSKGFDLNRPIQKAQCPSMCAYTYSQEIKC